MSDIKEIRKKVGMSQREFAEYYGFKLKNLQNWEAGRVKCPDYAL